MPFHASFFAVARFELDVAIATAGAARRKAARDAKRSRTQALRLAKKVAPRRSEVLRLAALHDARAGRATRALRGFAKALEVAGALDGRDAASYRAEAERLRTQMGLAPEPAAE